LITIRRLLLGAIGSPQENTKTKGGAQCNFTAPSIYIQTQAI
jgi:hypothetical protein